MAGLIPWGELDAAGDVTTGANIAHEQSRSQQAVDDRIKALGPTLVGYTPDVIEAAKAAVNAALAAHDFGLLEKIIGTAASVSENMIRDPKPARPASTYITGRCTLTMDGQWGKATCTANGATSFIATYGPGSDEARFAPAKPGQQVAAVIDLKGQTTVGVSAQVGITAYKWDGSAWSGMGNVVLLPLTHMGTGGATQTLNLAGTVPAGATHVSLQVTYRRTGDTYPTIGDAIFWRNAALIVGVSSASYFDGDTHNAFWVGTPDESPSMKVVPLGGGVGGEGSARREMLVDAFTARKGGSVGTGGLPAVALRFDHHLDSFQSKILPLLTERGLPWSQMVNPENLGSGDDNMTYAQLQSMCIQNGGEVWNHGGNHLDAVGDAAIYKQIMGALKSLQTGLPKLPIEGWAPPGLPVGGYDGYAPSATISEHADTYAGQLITAHHAVVAGYVPGLYRVLDATDRIGLTHATLDKATTLATARGYISGCPAGMGIALMLHPNYLDMDGYISTATLAQLFDWIADERDAGRLAVISYSGLWAADGQSDYRHDLLTVRAATGDYAQTVGMQRLKHLCGGMRELTASVTRSSAGTITTRVGDSVKTHSVAAGTSRVRHVAPIPLDAETLAVEVSGATSVTDAHMYAI